MTWLEKKLSGHWTVGPVTIFGLFTAMHGGIDIRLKGRGWLCLKPPTRVYGHWWPAYLYLSPDATPTKASFMLGRVY